MNFIEEKSINGHLTIIKKYSSGKEEILLDENNIIVSGMGFALSKFFSHNHATNNTILDYQIGKFQVGVSGPPAGGVVSSIFELSGALSSISEYGLGSNLVIESLQPIIGTGVGAAKPFANIPHSKITRVGDSSVRYTLVIDEEACNNLTRDSSDAYLNEIGLFVNNPLGSASENPILVAYKTFSNIYKTSDFSLIFRWTINF